MVWHDDPLWDPASIFSFHWRLANVPADAGAGGQAGRGRWGPLPMTVSLHASVSAAGKHRLVPLQLEPGQCACYGRRWGPGGQGQVGAPAMILW